jgi:UDP-N-acetylmuramyl pentapeptide phosphotransferase/UDP-N-acetylglucosamine-1-phosphate transferase
MLKEFMSDITVVSFFAVINSFLLVYFIIPKIRWVIVQRQLHDHPDDRSSHSAATPTMAGISFYITLIMTLFFIQNFDTDKIGITLIASSTLVFIVGVKDDLVHTTPRSKLGMETLAILFLLFSCNMQVFTLHGFLGIYEIPIAISYPVVILLILTIVNGFNIIDGIDGLASIIAIVIFSTFALIFYTTANYFHFLICLSFIGMLTAYLIYNFSHRKKIFMGDTGSLIIGFCIGFCALKFLAMDITIFSRFALKPENELIVLVGILFIPIFDLFRVIGVRLLNGKSPMSPDQNHIHHILVNTGLAHYKVALLLGALNYVIVILLILLSSHCNSCQLLAILLVIVTVLLGVFYKLKLNNQLRKTTLEI